MSRQLAKRWLTANEYERMGEAGILLDERLELIAGEIYEIPPIGSRHAACVDILSRLLRRQVEDFAIVRGQNPIRLDDYSEPQPDVAIVRWRDDFYRNAHPQPADVLFVIEVADTTLETDRQIKLPLYAAAGIAEVWIVNLVDEQIETHAGLSDGAYQSTRRFPRGEQAQAQTIPALTLNVADVLG